MRTTITIADDLLKKAQVLTGRSGYSEAIVTSLQEFVALKARLSLLHKFFSKRAPHAQRKIKRQRKLGRWSS